jgi:acyl-CoA thioesterase FadM
MYIVEEAVIEWFRRQGLGPQSLFREYGLGMEIIDSSVQLPALVEIDDELAADVQLLAPGAFSVRLKAVRTNRANTVLNGKVKVVLVREGKTASPKELPLAIRPLVVESTASVPDSERRDVSPIGSDNVAKVLTAQVPSGFVWSWQARYFHCHYSHRVQHSAYIRTLEEVVDRFLFHRGISIGRVLKERGWIPVVSRVRVKLIADAHMEETIHTTFVITEIMKGLAYDARMDCHVERKETLIHVATARILHGYAETAGSDAGRLTELDEPLMVALDGERM